ncbi:MAG: PKD domain-containing protein [Bacteroidetes bacterium]|nr:PKD domain-containing protein [Bacteroidota bacterium]
MLKYIGSFALLALMVVSCKKEHFDDVSFVSTSAAAGKTSAMFTITQDNTGLVTITPSGEGTVSYDVTLGDTTKTPVTVSAGKSIRHVYAEGSYQVKITGHDLKGGTSTTTQALTVSYIKPQDLVVKVNVTNLTVSVSASAKYATFYKVFYGDSTTYNPEPFTLAMANQNVTHTYASAGTYTVRVVALSGGAQTTTFESTIKVAKPISLPVTFEDPNTDYTMSDFGGNVSVLVSDPAGGGGHVMKTTKPAGAEVWAGTTVGGAAGFPVPVPLKPNAALMSVMVYSPAVGLDIKLKVEDHNDGTHSVETDVLTTKAGQWETLVFDLTHTSAGTPAFNASYVYDKASLFFDFGVAGSGKVFYFDNLQATTLAQIDLPVTFESSTVDYTVSDFGGNASTYVVDPVDNTNHCMKSVKSAGAEVWAGTTMGGANGFATVIPQTAAPKMTVRVYSPAVGLDIKLKLEEHGDGTHSVETDVLTTKAGQWETLTFDFSTAAPSTPAWNAGYKYDKCSIFFDFGVSGSGKTFYWDDVKLF